MNKIIVIFSLFIFVLLGQQGHASHFSGGDITATCVGPSQVQITVKLYWDCSAWASMPLTINLDLSSSCGGSSNYLLPLINVNGTEVSNLCPNDLVNSTCNGGSYPGRKEYIYQDVITVSSGCDPYVASIYDCCRDFTSNVPTSSFSGIYLETIFNTSVKPCNHSPVFNNSPIPYFCVNQPVSFNYSATESDGDSLVYSFVDAMDFGQPLAYGAGYSGAEPIPGITIVPQTGQMDFLPSTIGNFIVVVKVEEYDKQTGSLLSVVNRDVQFIVIPCTNNVPDNLSSGIIANLSPNAVKSGNNTIMVCEGESISFDLNYTDPDANDSLFLSTNLGSVITGAVLDTTGINPLNANIKWTVPIGSAGKNHDFTITVKDNACPVSGSQTFDYHIQVIGTVIAGPDQNICGGQKANLLASGGSVFTWKTISGDPITAANFSCNSCSNPKASPSVTTTYEVTSNLTGACKLKDTVVVKVVPDFNYSLTKSTANACLSQFVSMDVQTSPAANYIYNWTGNALYSNQTGANTNASFNEPGYNYAYIQITSPGGCVKQDSIALNIYTSIPPDVSLTASDSSVCRGDTVVLFAKVKSVFSASCGMAMVSCNPAGIDTFQLGTDIKQNTSSGYPAPYGNYSKTGRHQFIYLASELRAAGVKSKIGSISFLVNQITGNTIYDDFTVKMGCSMMSGYYTNNWEGGLTDVILPRQINIQNGWNRHLFDSEYEWDGISNLVVEVCFDNTSSPVSTNAVSTYSVTSFPSVLYYASNFNPACSFIGGANVSFNRPNILFTACSEAANPANYTFTWNAPLSLPALPSVKITPYASAIYSITVADKSNLCKTIQSVPIKTLQPLLSFTSDPDSGMAPLQVSFANTSASAVSNFSWTFGDGNTSTIENPANIYLVPGKYTVSMSGISSEGCKDTAYSDIIVKNVIPNVITPNGDNINDVFSVKIENLKSYHATIRNRWGAVVYEWSDPNGGWSADKVPAGVYYYVVEGAQKGGSLIKFHGSVTVVKE